MTSDGRVRRGERTKAAVLDRAMDIASREGLDGLTLGRLADELAVSKSGVFARFGSKEELQLATIEAAREVYVGRIVRLAQQHPPGAGRLRALCHSWLDYLRARTFPGGCFFLAAAAEYDARPGRVRDAIADNRDEWLRLLERTATDAQQLGELAPDCDTRQLAFELDALGVAANTRALLHDDESVFDLAAAGVDVRLAAAAP